MMRILLGLSVLLLFFSCSGNHPKTAEEYFKFLDSDASGLSKSKYVNGIQLRVKYLPPDYLCNRELGNHTYSQREKDSLINYYSKSLCFMITLSTDERKAKQGSIMYHNITQYKEYVQRTVAMNFEMQQFIRLKADENEYTPVLSSMDNVYGLEDSRNILLVFVPKTKEDYNLFKAEKLDFIYDDQLFELGINHFLFERKAFDNLPPFPFKA
jgi:hypothetical protein